MKTTLDRQTLTRLLYATIALTALMMTNAFAIGPRAMIAFVPQPASTQITLADGTATISPAQWSTAHGEADIYDNGTASDRATLYFSGLVPGGYYSVFTKQTGATDDTLAPLDGTGAKNSFTAKVSGTGYIEIVTPKKLTNADQIVLVYHSDGEDHGASAGAIGITAYPHLVAIAR